MAIFRDRPVGLVAIPEDPSLADIRDAVRHALERHGVEAMFPAEMADPTSAISTEVARRSDLVIADITNAEPELYYVLGVAHTLRKPVLLLAQQSARVPLHISGSSVLFYSPDETDKLSQFLDYWLRDSLAQTTPVA